MALIQVSMLTGRTEDQKRALVRALNDAMVEHAGVNPDYLHIVLTEYPRGDWARAGTLMSDLPSA